MHYISHRANLDGPNPERENHPDYISNALKQGFEAEIDVWYLHKKYYLGHDQPTYDVKLKFLQNTQLWLHCKTIETLQKVKQEVQDTEYFFHDNDDCTLTSGGHLWVYPRNLTVNADSIAVMPEKVPNWNVSRAGGVCTDYIHQMVKNINFKI